jgi:putative ABC transport system permease protein
VDNPKLIYGRGINEVDIAQRRKVCVIGSRIHQELFSLTENPCGKSFQIDGIYYTVVGVSGKTEGGVSIGGNATTTVLMPYTTLQQAYNIGSRVDILCLTAREGYDMTQVQAKAETVLKRAHRIHPDDKQAVNMVNAEAMFSMMDELFGGISILVWMIGVGTLLSGVIGVSNIMVVTVKERTTEIGIRRAIGATPADIIFMVMSESVVLTLLAGMSGITMAVLLLHGGDVVYSQVNPDAAPISFQITFSTALVAAGTLSVLGVLAGLAPAYRAMRIKPVDAMREE